MVNTLQNENEIRNAKIGHPNRPILDKSENVAKHQAPVAWQNKRKKPTQIHLFKVLTEL